MDKAINKDIMNEHNKIHEEENENIKDQRDVARAQTGIR